MHVQCSPLVWQAHLSSHSVLRARQEHWVANPSRSTLQNRKGRAHQRGTAGQARQAARKQQRSKQVLLSLKMLPSKTAARCCPMLPASILPSWAHLYSPSSLRDLQCCPVHPPCFCRAPDVRHKH
jgi:hypothetical protein